MSKYTVRFMFVMLLLAGVTGCLAGCRQSIQGKDEVEVIAQKVVQNRTEKDRTVLPFPNYNQEEYLEKFGIEPFEISLILPDGWEVKIPEDTTELGKENYGMSFAPMELYKGGQYAGVISCNTYEPMDDVPEEDYYKVVYSGIRLGSLCSWEMEPYTPITAGETYETALATVRYKDPEQMDSGKSAAEVPDIKVPGIVSYDKNLHVYITIQFAEESVSEEVESIAKSIVFE